MSARKWLKSERDKQSQAIQRWKPWELSTGPKTTEGKKIVSKNAWKGGLHPKDLEILKIANTTLREQKHMLQDLAKKCLKADKR